MKTSILTLLAAAGFAAAAFAAPVADATPEGEAKIISYNIRLGVADDGANSWEHRREATLRMLEREAPTVFGIQEGYLFQVKYIEENLPQYGRVGVGRDDGKEGGEIMAVFYLRDRYDLLDHGDLWLSETPDRVSRGWDGACNRTMTWVHLREKAPVTDRKGTYNGWGQAPNSMVIDHLFVRNMKCLSYRTLDGDYGVPYISDHYPIEIVVRLK